MLFEMNDEVKVQLTARKTHSIHTDPLNRNTLDSSDKDGRKHGKHCSARNREGGGRTGWFDASDLLLCSSSSTRGTSDITSVGNKYHFDLDLRSGKRDAGNKLLSSDLSNSMAEERMCLQ